MRRTSHLSRVASLFLPVAMAACAQPPSQETQSDTAPAQEMAVDVNMVRTQVSQVRQSWINAAQADDAMAVANLYADDAIMISDDGTLQNGRSAIETSLTDMLQATSNLQITPTDFRTDGGMATETGEYTMTATMPEGTTQDIKGMYLVVLKKQTDGSWKIVQHLSATPTMPPAATPSKM